MSSLLRHPEQRMGQPLPIERVSSYFEYSVNASRGSRGLTQRILRTSAISAGDKNVVIAATPRAAYGSAFTY